MKFTVSLLQQIWPEAKFVLLDPEKEFSHLNIATLKQFTKLPQEDILYFMVYEESVEEDGWYEAPFDRNQNMQMLLQNKSLSFVIDNRADESLFGNVPHVLVANIHEAIRKLREYVLAEVGVKVIGVTGSVGKTTTVAMMEHLLASRYGDACLRIYAKRLTPLTLSSWIVNFVSEETKYIVMEYCMYRPDHIEKLTQMLEPHIAIFLNARPVHLGANGINTMDDIIVSKMKLFSWKRDIVANNDDPAWKQLPSVDYRFGFIGSNNDVWIKEEGTDNFIAFGHSRLPYTPYVNTKLSYYQAMAAVLVAKLVGVANDAIADALATFTPKENRMQWITLGDKKVLFDGDVTYAARLAELADNRYKHSTLIVQKFDFGIENVKEQISILEKTLADFDEVRVLDSEENKLLFEKHGISKRTIPFMSGKHMLDGLISDSFIVYHYGAYFKKHTAIDKADLFF